MLFMETRLTAIKSTYLHLYLCVRICSNCEFEDNMHNNKKNNDDIIWYRLLFSFKITYNWHVSFLNTLIKPPQLFTINPQSDVPAQILNASLAAIDNLSLSKDILSHCCIRKFQQKLHI